MKSISSFDLVSEAVQVFSIRQLEAALVATAHAVFLLAPGRKAPLQFFLEEFCQRGFLDKCDLPCQAALDLPLSRAEFLQLTCSLASRLAAESALSGTGGQE